MRKAVKQIGVLALALLVFCLVCRLTVSRDYTIYVPLLEHQEKALRSGNIRMEIDTPGVLQPGEPEIRDGYLRLRLQPGQPGDAFIRFYAEGGEPEVLQAVRVGRFHTVFDQQTGGFTGDRSVMIAVTLFWLLVSSIMLWHFLQARGPAFYAYATIYYAGFSIFSLVTGLVHIFLPGRSALLGASGVDFALILLASVTGSRTGNAIPLTLIIVAIIYIGQQVYQGLTTADNISQLTHIIGGSIGAVYGMAVQRGKH